MANIKKAFSDLVTQGKKVKPAGNLIKITATTKRI